MKFHKVCLSPPIRGYKPLTFEQIFSTMARMLEAIPCACVVFLHNSPSCIYFSITSGSCTQNILLGAGEMGIVHNHTEGGTKLEKKT